MPRSKDSTQQTFRYINYFLLQNRKLFVKNVSGQNTCTMNLNLKLHFIKNIKKKLTRNSPIFFIKDIFNYIKSERL